MNRTTNITVIKENSISFSRSKVFGCSWIQNYRSKLINAAYKSNLGFEYHKDRQNKTRFL